MVAVQVFIQNQAVVTAEFMVFPPCVSVSASVLSGCGVILMSLWVATGSEHFQVLVHPY